MNPPAFTGGYRPAVLWSNTQILRDGKLINTSNQQYSRQDRATAHNFSSRPHPGQATRGFNGSRAVPAAATVVPYGHPPATITFTDGSYGMTAPSQHYMVYRQHATMASARRRPRGFFVPQAYYPMAQERVTNLTPYPATVAPRGIISTAKMSPVAQTPPWAVAMAVGSRDQKRKNQASAVASPPTDVHKTLPQSHPPSITSQQRENAEGQPTPSGKHTSRNTATTLQTTRKRKFASTSSGSTAHLVASSPHQQLHSRTVVQPAPAPTKKPRTRRKSKSSSSRNSKRRSRKSTADARGGLDMILTQRRARLSPTASLSAFREHIAGFGTEQDVHSATQLANVLTSPAVAAIASALGERPDIPLSPPVHPPLTASQGSGESGAESDFVVLTDARTLVSVCSRFAAFDDAVLRRVEAAAFKVRDAVWQIGERMTRVFRGVCDEELRAPAAREQFGADAAANVRAWFRLVDLAWKRRVQELVPKGRDRERGPYDPIQFPDPGPPEHHGPAKTNVSAQIKARRAEFKRLFQFLKDAGNSIALLKREEREIAVLKAHLVSLLRPVKPFLKQYEVYLQRVLSARQSPAYLLDGLTDFKSIIDRLRALLL